MVKIYSHPLRHSEPKGYPLCLIACDAVTLQARFTPHRPLKSWQPQCSIEVRFRVAFLELSDFSLFVESSWILAAQTLLGKLLPLRLSAKSLSPLEQPAPYVPKSSSLFPRETPPTTQYAVLVLDRFKGSRTSRSLADSWAHNWWVHFPGHQKVASDVSGRSLAGLKSK